MRSLRSFLLVFFVAFVSLLVSLEYPGNKLIYFTFSVLCISVLYKGLKQRKSFFVFFVSVFLFLGFWVKSVTFFWLKKPLLEPVGDFSYLKADFDHVFLVIISGLAAVLTLQICLDFFNRNKLTSINFIKNNLNNFCNEEKHINIFYIALFGFSIFIASINFYFGVHQVGLTPRTIFIWPLNAGIAFLINIGVAITFTYIKKLDKYPYKLNRLKFLCMLLSLWVISLSTLSRSIFIFQAVPLLLVYVFDSLRLRAINFSKKNISIVILSIFLILVSILIAGILRKATYLNTNSSNVSVKQKLLIRLEVLNGSIDEVKKRSAYEYKESDLERLNTEKNEIENKLVSLKLKTVISAMPSISSIFDVETLSEGVGAFNDIGTLAVSRFIGLEGVMAVESYSHKSPNLLFWGAFEKRTLNSQNIYQDIAKSNYRYTDQSVWQLSTLPGIIAFFYYSGSCIVVLFAVFLMGALFVGLEYLTGILSGANKYTMALVGCSLASIYAQFGVTPRVDMFYLTLVLTFLLTLNIIISAKIYFLKMVKN